MKLRLYHYWRSSASWRVRWAFALKKIPCEFAVINLLEGEESSPEHLKRNPMGAIPVLEFLDRVGPLRFLGESLAIIQWADETFAEPPLFPQDSIERARVRQLAEIVNAGIHPLQNPNVPAYLTDQADDRKRWSQHWIREGLSGLEALVSETAGRHAFGDQITLADLCIVPQVFNALRYEVDLSAFPTLGKVYESARETDACQASAPEKFKPDA